MKNYTSTNGTIVFPIELPLRQCNVNTRNVKMQLMSFAVHLLNYIELPSSDLLRWNFWLSYVVYAKLWIVSL